MNKHEAAIALALIEAGHPRLASAITLVLKLPWRSIIGIGSATALGASFRWHDVEGLLALLP
jgi:hypothetical protein